MMESRKKCTLILATFHTTLLSSLIIAQRVFLSSHKKITSEEFFQFIRVLCFYMACISSVQCTVLFFSCARLIIIVALNILYKWCSSGLFHHQSLSELDGKDRIFSCCTASVAMKNLIHETRILIILISMDGSFQNTRLYYKCSHLQKKLLYK